MVRQSFFIWLDFWGFLLKLIDFFNDLCQEVAWV